MPSFCKAVRPIFSLVNKFINAYRPGIIETLKAVNPVVTDDIAHASNRESSFLFASSGIFLSIMIISSPLFS